MKRDKPTSIQPIKYKFTVEIRERVPNGDIQAWESQIWWGGTTGAPRKSIYGDTEAEVIRATQTFCDQRAADWRESVRKEAALKPRWRYEITL